MVGDRVRFGLGVGGTKLWLEIGLDLGWGWEGQSYGWRECQILVNTCYCLQARVLTYNWAPYHYMHLFSMRMYHYNGPVLQFPRVGGEHV